MVRHVRIANQWQGTYELRIGGQARSLQEFMGSSLLLPNFIASFQIIAVLIIHFCTYLSILYILQIMINNRLPMMNQSFNCDP